MGNQMDMPGEEGETFDFFGVLNRRKWLVFLGLVTGMGLGGLYHANAPLVYESTANIRIEPKAPRIFNVSGSEAMLPSSEDDVLTRHDRMIGQDFLLRLCLEKNGLNNLPSFQDVKDDEVVREVMENLEVLPDLEDPFIYMLTYRCSKPDDARTLLNNLIETYRNWLDENHKNESDEFVHLLKEVRNQFQDRYVEQREEVASLLNNIDAPAIINGRTVHHMKIAELGRTIEEAQAAARVAHSDRERVLSALSRGEAGCKEMLWTLLNEGKIRNDGASSSDNRAAEGVLSRLQDLEIARLEVVERYGPRHPRVKSIDRQITHLQERLAGNQEAEAQQPTEGFEPQQVMNLHLASLEKKILDSQSIIRISMEQYQIHEEEAIKIMTNERRIEDAKEDLTYTKELLTKANDKIVELDPTMRLDGTRRQEGFRFNLLKNATAGEQVWPILPVILGIGGLLGSLVGFGLGCLVELADKTFHNPSEIMKQLNVPLIGHIPVITQNKRYLVENSLIEPVVCTYHRPKSQVSEAFRAVRTALYFNTQGKKHSVIQVTSPTPGDGKSTLAANLAVSIAQSGKRVLLVDSDMRRPRQNVTFGITAKEGVAAVLSGQCHWRDVLYECEEIDGLTVMPCGAKPNNPAELSSSPQVKELIEEMREEFDFVVIDTPPLLAVTDASPIAARVDGVILTLRIKKNCLLYTSPSPRDQRGSRMPSSA